MSNVKLLLLFIDLIFIHTVGSNNVHYITPSSTTKCPRKFCLTLSILAANSKDYFDSNTTLVFLNGNHTLESEFVVSNIDGSLMLSSNGSDTADIICSAKVSLKLSHITRLHFRGIRFINCSSKVELVDRFTLEDSRFHSGIGGSALHLSGTNTTIVRSSFVSNRAGTYQSQVRVLAYIRDNPYEFPHPNTQSTSARVGGALFVTKSTVSISSSHFEKNTAIVGGAIFAQKRSNIIIINCTIVNNSATGCTHDDRCHGGAIFTDSGCTVTAHNCTFTKNTAGYGGGAIALFQGSSIDSSNNVFSDNKADTHGGAISAYSSSRITIDNSCYKKNTGKFGGAIYTHGYNRIILVNSFFDNNVAGRGGVVYAQRSSSITVSNSSFDSNGAHYSGGAMYAHYYSRIIVGNSSFSNNVAGLYGGALATSFSSIAVDSSSFGNNEVGDDGGVIYAASISSVTVSNSSFHNNVAGDNGGVMSTWDDSSITVSNSSFGNSVAGNDGGVIYATSSSRIVVSNSSFDNSVADYDGGILYASSRSSISVNSSSFGNSVAGHDGGVIYASSSSSITVDNSLFDNNIAHNDGGGMYSMSGSITVSSSSFHSNQAGNGGGVIYIHMGSFKDLGGVYVSNIASNGGVIILDEGNVNIMASSFHNNTADNIGGVLYVPNYVYKHHITLVECTFNDNQATSGGVIALLANDDLNVTESTFLYNSAIRGGVIYLHLQNRLIVKYSNFSHNSVNGDGGVIYSADQNVLIVDNSVFNFNGADNSGGVLCSLFQTGLTVTGDNCAFIGNQGHRGGVVYASESKIYVHSRNLLLANNTATDNGGAVHLSSANVTFFSENNTIIGNKATSGGAIFATDSQLVFSDGSCQLVENQADYGGAIYASESKLVVKVNSWINVSANLAMHHGGGLYMTMSQLNAKGYGLYITKNQANSKGGGIHADNSSVITKGVIHLIGNEAENGGAISLERNAKLNGKSNKNDIINLISNRAYNHGGALYVDDKTNPEMCAAITAQNKVGSLKTECFSNSVFINFSNNFAGTSGINLYGGLFDRCMVQTQSYQKNEIKELGFVIFQNSSSINETQLDTVSSGPVRLCFCRDSQPDCNYQPEIIKVNRGKAFSLQLIAYNHILKPVRAAIDIDSSASGTIAGQYINKVCTEVVLQFNLSTHVDYANLTLSVIGPCSVAGVSKKSAVIQFICTCPIGFQILNNNNISCDCVCDKLLQSYQKTECNPMTQSIIRRENFWISYINHTWPNVSGYLIYPHCPFDYCYTPHKSVSINLNLPNGSDAQCDLNRIGTLCGTCRSGLSVSLGSSKCVLCPTYWPGLLATITTVFIISGIGLVAFLLALNLTVAIGTINAIIFYANIVAANKSALFPSGVSPASVFISWLNFDLGFDICFFDGMDTYVKTWLQLAFPAYIIILVIVIIQLSYYFDAFGHLVGKKDPIATLATLILLSYTKLLQTIITAFSFATLVYPDGSKKTLWLPDATLEYFTSKHAVLIFIAILILVAGLIYTFLLSSWQWFLWCPRKRVKWIRNQKFCSFIEIFLIPYTPKHRYWTGLLLLVRVSVYLVSAFNPSGDPRVTLSATNFVMTSLVIYIATFGVRLYKNHFINIMETLTYFNIMALTIFTWYTIDADTNQTAITNVSIGITFIQLTVVILYHVYKHTNQKLFTIIQGSAICIKMKEMLTPKKQKQVNHKPAQVDEDIHQFHMLIDMIDRPANTDDYNIPQIQPKPVEPTQSVVEIPKPIKAVTDTTPPPLEAIEEEQELKSELQQASEQDGTDVNTMFEEDLSMEINKNKQYINNDSGIEISECDNIITNPGCEINHSCTIQTENFIPDAYPSPQDSDVKQAQEAMKIHVDNNMVQSSQDVLVDSGQQEGNGSHCIIVEAEIHDY